MKFYIKRAILHEKLNALLPILPKSTALPMLSHLLLECRTQTGQLRLTVTDLDNVAQNLVDADTILSGACCVEAKLLADILDRLSDDDVTIERPDSGTRLLKVISGGTEIELPVLDAAEFPPSPQLEQRREVRLPAAILRQAMAYAVPCMSEDDTRFILMGVNLQFTRNAVHVTATDGRRLSTFPVDAPVHWLPATQPDPENEDQTIPLESVNITVPAAAARLMLSLLRNEDEPDATLILNGDLKNPTHLHVTVDEQLSLTTKLIVGNYPNWRLVVPAGINEGFRIPVADLIPALRRAAALRTEKNYSVQLELNGRQLRVSLQNNAGARLLDAIALCGIPAMADGFRMMFDVHYLLAAARMVQGEYLRFDLADSSRGPAVISDQTLWQHVLMPMAEPKAEPKAGDEAEADASPEATTETKAA